MHDPLIDMSDDDLLDALNRTRAHALELEEQLDGQIVTMTTGPYMELLRVRAGFDVLNREVTRRCDLYVATAAATELDATLEQILEEGR